MKFSALTFNEKLGLGLFILLVPVYFLAVAITDAATMRSFASGLLWTIVWAIIAFIAAAIALATVFLKPDPQPSATRRNLGRFVPAIAVCLALMTQYGVGQVLEQRRQLAFAQAHSADLAGKTPQAVQYAEGIPDGGIAIIRSPGENPVEFALETMLDLTGERIDRCRSLSPELWSCHFD